MNFEPKEIQKETSGTRIKLQSENKHWTEKDY